MAISLSPIYSLMTGYSFIVVIVLTFYFTGFYDDSIYFTWGPPVVFFNHTVNTQTMFYVLLLLIFSHQLITNWISEVIFPWVINNVQNRQQEEVEYSKATCLTIVNLNALYNQIHLAFVISGITSQISFLVSLVLADFITLSIINWQYLKGKTVVRVGAPVTGEIEMEEIV